LFVSRRESATSKVDAGENDANVNHRQVWLLGLLIVIPIELSKQ